MGIFLGGDLPKIRDFRKNKLSNNKNKGISSMGSSL
jgi:hypothetical protein